MHPRSLVSEEILSNILVVLSLWASLQWPIWAWRDQGGEEARWVKPQCDTIGFDHVSQSKAWTTPALMPAINHSGTLLHSFVSLYGSIPAGVLPKDFFLFLTAPEVSKLFRLSEKHKILAVWQSLQSINQRQKGKQWRKVEKKYDELSSLLILRIFYGPSMMSYQ